MNILNLFARTLACLLCIALLYAPAFQAGAFHASATGSLILQESDVVEVQEAEDGASEGSQEGEDGEADKEEEEELISTAPKEIDPRIVKLHLWDGTIITGEMSTEAISVETEYGTLVVPVENVLELEPGLESYPQILTNLDSLVEQLGDVDYNTRQAARKELTGMGLKIKNEIERFTDGGNAERKKHLDEIKKELAQIEDEAGEFEEESERIFIRGDALTTPTFTVVGKVQEEQFEVKSKYGLLTVQLQDVKKIDRPRSGGEEVRRMVVVSGSNLMQNNLKSSGIRVNKGDIVTVSAEGSITMSPWGSNRTSNPDGSTTYGWYIANEIAGGALAAKIGDSGTPMHIGRKKRFVAKKTGLLKFGIGMQASYAGGNYNFPGEYKVKISVSPAD